MRAQGLLLSIRFNWLAMRGIVHVCDFQKHICSFSTSPIVLHTNVFFYYSAFARDIVCLLIAILFIPGFWLATLRKDTVCLFQKHVSYFWNQMHLTINDVLYLQSTLCLLENCSAFVEHAKLVSFDRKLAPHETALVLLPQKDINNLTPIYRRLDD